MRATLLSSISTMPARIRMMFLPIQNLMDSPHISKSLKQDCHIQSMWELTILCHLDQLIQRHKMDVDIFTTIQVLFTYFFSLQSQETILCIRLKSRVWIKFSYGNNV